MNIAIVGTGYVGLVTGACLADMGNIVTCIDINVEKIENLKKGILPIYEPGLEDIVKSNFNNKRLNFETDLHKVINDVDVVFSAVGTPPQEDGSADLQYVLNVAKEFGEQITHHTVFVTKSTVPVGTAEKVREIINTELKKRNSQCTFDVVSNPEFLKEGTAVKDFLYPERIVIGVDSEQAKNVMYNLYKTFARDNQDKLIFTDIPSAEMIKYASNAMLATRISFMNEIANLCEKVGANVEFVRKGMGTDSRIGSKFLYAGCGYGGSCFPKDVKALIRTGVENDEVLSVLQSVDSANEKQKTLLYKKLIKHLIDVKDKTIGILGLSFKPETDDMREAPSIVLINEIIRNGGIVKVYDPIAMDVCKSIFKDDKNIQYCNIIEVIENIDALVLITEWKEFRTLNWEIIKSQMKGNIIIDGRNIYDRRELEDLGFIYDGFGK